MSAIASVRPSTGPADSRSTGATSEARGAPTLPGFDLQAALFDAQNLIRTARSKTALGTAQSAQANRDNAIGDAKAALARAEEEQRAAETKGKWIGVLRTVGTVAALVVATAAVVFTGGASALAVVALAGVLISASSPYVADATGSQKLGLALALTGAAMSLTAGGISLFTSAATATATTMTAAEKVVLVAGRLTSAAAEVGQGAAAIARGDDEADAIELRAEAQGRRADAAAEQVVIDESIAALEQAERSNRRAINSILAVGDTLERARAATITNIRRA